jgi:hypothetical protein
LENSLTPRIIRLFEESEDASHDSRRLAERDRDYYDGKQLTSTEEAALTARGQPPVIYNRIQRKVNYLTGLEKQSRKDPKCFPRTPKDEGGAQAATDALRYSCDNGKWDKKRSSATKNLIIEGTCAIMIGVTKTPDGADPDFIYIPWDRLFWDPHSSEHDFSDAGYMGIVTWMDEADAKDRFPGKDAIIEATISNASKSDTYDDKPKWKLWADYSRRRIRVVEGYYKVGETWRMCIATEAGELVEAQDSPYLDEDGKPENPIKAISLYVDRDNDRYGEVRVMISPQDEINKRRSKGLHLATMRQSRVGRSSGLNAEEVRKQLARPDGSIIADKDDFEILPTNDMEQANFQMMQEAKAEIDLLGPNAALAGKNENDMSGRAILAQQQGGMVEVADIMDAIRELSLAVYRSTWARIRQFWQGPRWVRVTDDERNLRFVGLNQPVTIAQLGQQVQQGDEAALETARKLMPGGMLDAALQGDQQAMAAIGMFMRDHGQEVVKVENQISELDVDIVIDEGMDTPTVAAEQFDTLAKVIPNAVNLPPPYVKMLIQASSLRDKDKILEEIEKLSQGPQVPPEIEQKMQEMQQALQQLEQENQALKADAEGKAADRQIKGVEVEIKQGDQEIKKGELRVKAFEAQTNRIEALKPEPQPQQQAAA